MKRRQFLKTMAPLALASAVNPRWLHAADARTAAEQAHTEIWRRFIDQYGIMLDFTDLDGSVELPTPEECREGKPNALGWWSPIENGPMFSGMYMDAAVNRWKHTQHTDDAAKARKLMQGLLLVNSISDQKGFVGRGVSTDGKSHYAMGSNDQTNPWFYGLWRYLESGIATEAEREQIVSQLVETAEAIVALNWSMPAEPPFNVRGSFADFTFDNVPRLLFVCRILYQVTGDAKWDVLYRKSLAERGGEENLSRLEICQRGMKFHYARYHTWTSGSSVADMRSLWELETDEAVKAAYAQGLQASAELALKSLPMAEQFDHNDPTTFDPDWRMMNAYWKPQQTDRDSQNVAHVQLREFLKVSPRRGKETEYVREPAAATWVVSLTPNKEWLGAHVSDVERVIAHYDYSKLYYSQFFWVEAAWWRLQDL